MKTLHEVCQIVKNSLVVTLVAGAGLACGTIYRGLTVPIPAAAAVTIPATKPPRTVMALPAPLKAKTHEPNLRHLFGAVCMVESSGGRNPKAFKENYCNALGIAQVRPCVLEDLKQFTGASYELSDRLDTEKSWEMFRDYTGLWVKRYKLADTFENRARIWYGGPRGASKSCTLGYWSKVESYL